MEHRNPIWTFVIVTSITVLIWLLAANATREQLTVNTTLSLDVTGTGQWLVEPPLQRVTITMEGASFSLQNTEAALTDGLEIGLAPEVGEREVPLLDRLREHERLRDAGVTVLSVEPQQVQVAIDERRPYPARIIPELPGVQAEGEVEIDPPSATAFMPSRSRQLLPEELVVEAFVEPSVLANLEAGRRHTREARLRLRDASGAAIPSLNVEPDSVNVSFSVKSRISQTTREAVRVHISGPHEDFAEYDIQIDPERLSDITISADADIIRMIESREANVVAVVHLSNRDKAQGIRSKPVAYFAVLRDGWRNGLAVEGRPADGSELPEIGLTITRRAQE